MDNNTDKHKIIVGVTGASGMLYLEAFLKLCEQQENLQVFGICSNSGRQVLRLESDRAPGNLPGVAHWFDIEDFAAPPASGSSEFEAMVILPCSMGTLAAVANGLSINLIHRSADVILKERKKLILGVRETPFNRNHLENMLKAHDAGAVICPPMPSFYLKPTNLKEAAIFFAWRLLDQLSISSPERKRWGD